MSTTTVLLLFAALLFLLLNGFGFWFLLRRMNGEKKEEGSGDGLKLLLDQMGRLSETVDRKLGENSKQMYDSIRTQFGESQRLIKEVTVELTSVKETGRQVVSFADQLKSLQDILKNPKQRGVLGEYYLETLLKNVLPPGSYQMQYPFGNGEIVDAAVFVKDKIIPIDSKFSLENYNRLSEAKDQSERERLEKVFVSDLKNRIVETSKYIRPSENTTDFAFMFIPHEAIYYDLLVNKVGMITEETENLIQRAAGKYKVIIVSPTSFLAYLQTVLQGLKAMHIEEQAQEIIKKVGDLGKHVGKYEEFMKKLGISLGTTVSHYNTAYKEFGKVDKDVLKIAGKAAEVSPLVLEKPMDAEE